MTFLNLPVELRSMVYHWLFNDVQCTIGRKYSKPFEHASAFYISSSSGDPTDPDDVYDKLGLGQYHPHPVCHVNSLIREESLIAFHKLAHYTAHPSPSPRLLTIPTAMCQNIQNLDICVFWTRTLIVPLFPSIRSITRPTARKSTTIPELPILKHLTIYWNAPVGFESLAQNDFNEWIGWDRPIKRLIPMIQFRKSFKLTVKIHMYDEAVNQGCTITGYEMRDCPMTAIWQSGEVDIWFVYKAGEKRRKTWENDLLADLFMDYKQSVKQADNMVRGVVQDMGLGKDDFEKLAEIMEPGRIFFLRYAWNKHFSNSRNLWELLPPEEVV